ncbi:MAG: hypothetical protein NUW22_12405 [Acidobacteria bacterium]|nr:hypothetical protein [Acidobacteriota bacterium]
MNTCSECDGLGTVECECIECHQTHDRPCPRCADQNPRERGDDDGVEYADPRDAMAERLERD